MFFVPTVVESNCVNYHILRALHLSKWFASKCILYMYIHTHTHSSLGVFEFNVIEFSAQEEDADIDDDPVLDQGTGDIVHCIAT